MNRVEKIKLLSAIQEGSISKRVLTRPKSYVFNQKDDGDELLYTMNGKIYTKEEHDKICDEIEVDNKKLKAIGLKELITIVITVVIVRGKTIL